MNMPQTNLPKLSKIKQRFKQFSFAKHEIFHWSPQNNTVFYDERELNEPEGIYQLLHEIGHATSGHQFYSSGIQLLKIETEAWKKAQELAKDYGLKIQQKQIERCLDSYRDWLHFRSICPQCEAISIEVAANQYHCFNCLQKWSVPSDQQRRHYRLKQVFTPLES